LLTVTHAWAVGQCRIKALNDEALAVQIKGRARYPFVEFEPDQRFWMENYRAALDAPGEWFLDKAKGEVLYLPLPGEDMTKAEVIAPVVTKFIVMKGAHDVRFEGISFQYSQHLYPADGLHDGQAATTSDGCIEIEDSRGIHFRELRDRAHRPAWHLVQKRLRGLLGEALPPPRPRRRWRVCRRNGAAGGRARESSHRRR
jgi:hypothetical protein